MFPEVRYIARIHGRNVMYCCGDPAATPELAREATGSMRVRQGDRVGIWRQQYLGMIPSPCTATRGIPMPEWGRDTLIELDPPAEIK